jgi:acetoin utilization deacetylase AcuC-like enzyme
MTTVFWSPDYLAAAEEFDTTRKSEWVIESLIAEPVGGIRIAAPPVSADADLEEVHDSTYLEAVRTGNPRDLAESQGFRWDPGLWTASVAHAGGMVAAALHALRNRRNAGSLSSGLHHARSDRGAGFCTFNGIALAAKRALQAGARAVLIIDTDAHCAGGTHSLIAGTGSIRLLDLAVHPYDAYKPAGANTLDLIGSATLYLGTLRSRLREVGDSGKPYDLCIYYAGMDPFERCRIGGMKGVTFELLGDRERIVFDWCRERSIPVAFGIGGGYVNADFARRELVALHRLTLRAAA